MILSFAPFILFNLGGTAYLGCSVETHDEGRVIVFDDSRNHRAFCYGDYDRIVLILDLERSGLLPRGTATGKSALSTMFVCFLHVLRWLINCCLD